MLGVADAQGAEAAAVVDNGSVLDAHTLGAITLAGELAGSALVRG